MRCNVCMGKKKIYVPALKKLVTCPHCHKDDGWEYNEIVNGIETKVTKYDRLLIPHHYRGLLIDNTDTLFTEVMGVLDKFYSHESIKRVVTSLDRLYMNLYNGNVPHVSVYYYLSNYVDNKLLVYSLQKVAEDKGLSVVPYISANVLYGVQKARDYNVYSLLNGLEDRSNMSADMLLVSDGFKTVKDTGFTYYDYINADVCFIETTANTTDKGWIGVADLLNERAKKGKSTFIIGYYSHDNAYIGNGKYLFCPEGLKNRLDLLSVVELQTKRYGSYRENNKESMDLKNFKKIDLNVSSNDILGN